jgi:hypothetical protein
VAGELGGAELLLEDFAGVLAVVAPGLVFGEAGFDLLVDAGIEGLRTAAVHRVSRWPVPPGPVLGLADLLTSGQVAVVALDDPGEDGFGGGLLGWLLAGRGVGPVTTWAGLDARPRVRPTY